ncbi:MAG: hypothetical protein K6B41_02310, partial [Butyrivibrio sp.]|nr:hypothetical protein [Butyrivibrio sp.]
MSEHHEIPEGDSFLKSIKSRLLQMGVVAVGATLIIGVLSTFSLLRVGSINKVIYNMNHISELQFDNREIENSYFDDSTSNNKLILHNLSLMKAYIRDSRKQLPETCKNIDALESIITTNETNYIRMNNIDIERGYNSETGLYEDFLKNSAIYEKDLELISSTDSKTEGKPTRVSTGEFDKKVIDGKSYIRYQYKTPINANSKSNHLQLKLTASQFDYFGDYYINKIFLYRNDGSYEILPLGKIDVNSLNYSSENSDNLSIIKFNGMYSLYATISLSKDSLTPESIIIDIPLGSYKINNYSHISYDIYMEPCTGLLNVSTDLVGKYNYSYYYENFLASFTRYNTAMKKGTTSISETKQMLQHFDSLYNAVNQDIEGNSKLEYIITDAENVRNDLEQMLTMDSTFIIVQKYNSKLFDDMTKDTEIITRSVENQMTALMKRILAIIIITFILSCVSLFIYALYLRKSITKSIVIFNELKIAKAEKDAQNTFLSNVSHELRTPINAIQGLNEIILRKTSDPETKSYLVDIKNATKTLLTLVNGILDFAKLEAGKFEIIPIEYELSSVLVDVIAMNKLKANEKNLEFITEIDETIPNKLIGDELRIKQCINNIFSNAVKYTNKGNITLKVKYKNISDTALLLNISIKDTGVGIKAEDIPKLYDRFERIDEKRNRTIEGTGLGINIVNSLLDMMGSKLEVESEFGKGSTFSFTIKQEIVDSEPIGALDKRHQMTVDEEGHYHEKFKAPSARVLVVDDTSMNLTVIKSLLKPTEVLLDTAMSGHEMLEMVTKQIYDIIFIDYRM